MGRKLEVAKLISDIGKVLAEIYGIVKEKKREDRAGKRRSNERRKASESTNEKQQAVETHAQVV